jgi:beta-lactam-binding protein with PASTA domain
MSRSSGQGYMRPGEHRLRSFGYRRRRRSARGALGAGRGSLPVWGLILALGVAATAFMSVLVLVDRPLVGLKPLIAEMQTLLQPRALRSTKSDQLVPRPEPAGAEFLTVPSILGLDEESGHARLEDVGLRLRVDETFDTAVAPGRFSQQVPSAGVQLERLGLVTGTISRGPPLASLPSVVGLRSADARDLLDVSGFQVVELAVFNEDVVAGTVLGQNPLAGAVIDRRSVVTLQVSQGVENVHVPLVIGRSENDARRAIELAGLQLGQIVYRERGSVPNGIVETQKPGVGSSVPRGASVQITVVRVGDTTVPSVVGLELSAAERELLDRGLFVDSMRLVSTSRTQSAVVVGQEPGPGAHVSRGYGVRLTIETPLDSSGQILGSSGALQQSPVASG